MEAASVEAEPSPDETRDGKKENETSPEPAEPQNGHDFCEEQDQSDSSDESDYSDYTESTDTEPEWDSESESDDEDSTHASPVAAAASAHGEKSLVESTDWSDEVRTADVCAFNLQPGLKETVQAKTPLDFLNLMFQKPLFENLVRNVNKNGRKMLNATRIRQWNDVTVNEIRVFLGSLFNIGTIQAEAADLWSKGREVYVPKDYMSEDRFKMILKCLDFVEEVPDKKNRMFKVSLIVKYFNDVMKNVITPEKTLCIHESIGGFHETLYLLTDQHGLVHKLLLYKAIDEDDFEEMPKRERDEFIQARAIEVVRKLLNDRLGIGHSIYMDCDYNSVELAKFLVAHHTHVTGTLKRKKEGNPPEIIGKPLNVGEKITKYNPDGICVMIWKKLVDYHVVMISSEHSSEWQEDTNKRRPSSKKPACVLEFKKNGDGVRTHDEMMMDYYYMEQKWAWHKKVGIHILQMLLLNAYIMYKRHGDQPPLKRLLNFRKVVIGHLLSGSD